MKRVIRRISTAVVVVSLGVLLIYAFRPGPVLVDVGKVTRGALQLTIDEDGQTRAHDRFTLTAPVAGLLSRTTLHEGDEVAKDTIIAWVHPLPADTREEKEIRAQIATAQALNREAEQQTGRAEAAHQQSLRDLARAQMLFDAGMISREQFESAQAKETTLSHDLEAARQHANAAAAEVTRAEAGLISLGSELSRKSQAAPIRAPVRGRILRILEQSEHVLTAGTAIATLSNTNKLEIVADLLSTDAVKISPGAAVSIENWGGDNPLRARVRTIEPFGFTKVSALGIEEQRVNIVADFLDPPANLGDGYRVDVRITYWESAGVLKVPSSALFRAGQDWNVFVLESGLAHARRVEIDHRNALEAEVKSGLMEGETVVLHPSNDVRDGLVLKLRTE